MASFPAEDKKISRILIKNPALKTINKNAIRDNLLTIITSVLKLPFFLIPCKEYFLITEFFLKRFIKGCNSRGSLRNHSFRRLRFSICWDKLTGFLYIAL